MRYYPVTLKIFQFHAYNNTVSERFQILYNNCFQKGMQATVSESHILEILPFTLCHSVISQNRKLWVVTVE